MQRHTPRTRDAALRRLRAANRWLIAGSAALTGIFTAVAANAFPGHTIKQKASNASSRSRTGKATNGRGASGSSSQLKSPASAPEASSKSGAEAGESSSGVTSGESVAPSEEATRHEEASPAEESPPAEEKAPSQESSEASKATEAEKPAQTQTQPEAPVVSGGS